MKRYLIPIILFAFWQTAFAQTSVSGSIAQNTTWSLSNSPYLVTGTVTVQSGITLTIQPGVVIKSQVSPLNVTIRVIGAILAQGTQSQPIVFTSRKDDAYGGDTNNDGDNSVPSAGDWSILRIESTGGLSVFNHCYFRYGGFASGSGATDAVLNIEGSSPSVTNCTFFRNHRGIDVTENASPIIINNSFENCTNVPVAKDVKSQLSFEDNFFADNNGLNAIGLLNNVTNIPNSSYVLNKTNAGGITNIPYAPLGRITIESTNTLNIASGVVIKSFVNPINENFIIRGAMIAQGTVNDPIVFTSRKDDEYGGDANNDGDNSAPLAGDWSILRIESTGGSSVFNHCYFRYGGYASGSGATDAVLNIEGSSPSVTNCTFFRNHRGVDVTDNASPIIINNNFENCTNVPVAKDVKSQLSFEDNFFSDNNGLNAIGLLNNATNIPNSSYVLNKTNAGGITNIPYAPLGRITIESTNTLNIAPGVVIKSLVNPINENFIIRGSMIAQGTVNDPIVFTSRKDDEFGGDSNNDGDNSVPLAGDWSILRVESTGGSSVFNHCYFRYGGFVLGSGATDAVLNIEGSSPSVTNCIFFSNHRGIDMTNSNTQISSVRFSQNRIGLQIDNSSAEITRIDSSLFCQNSISGVKILSGSVTIISSSFFNNNIYDIENQSSFDVNASLNWWHYDNYLAILSNPSSNFANIFDRSDSPEKGVVNVSNPNKPRTDFNYDFTGYQVFFNNITPDVDNFTWNFGDNTQSSQVNPSHKYSEPGYYDVCLEPTYCDNNLRGSICKSVLVKGLKTLYPTVSANNNTFIGLISGAGFTPNDVVILSKPGQSDIVADTVIYFDSTLIKVFFTFDEVAVGNWDLSVNGLFLSEILPNALRIETTIPVSLSAFVEGRNRIRTNRPTKMRIGVRNNSNQIFFGVPLNIKLSANFDVIVKNEILLDTIPDDVSDHFENNFFKVPVEGSINDTSLVGVFLIPVINPYEVFYIDLIVKSTAPSSDTIRVSTGLPWFEASELRDEGVLYRTFPELPPCFKCAMLAAEYLPGGPGCAAAFYNNIFETMETINDYNNGNYASTAIGVINIGIGVATIATCWSGLSLSAVAGTVGHQLDRIGKGLDGIDDGPDCIDCAKDQFPGVEFPYQTGNSFDPNDKIGQYGATENHYFNGQETLNYTIFFENLDSASAPASEVFITDIIDTTTLNIQTIKFTGFGFGDKQYQFIIPISDTSFTYDINLNPDKNIILRVNGKVDYTQNQVSWSFRSFDPVTMDLTEDIDLGFLPPNVISPEGEGFVTFTIEPKPNLPHLTEINNGASIVFDNNLPIITPIWKNTIDKIKPESYVLSFPSVQTDTSFNVMWTGNDTESGVSFYDIFYSVNGNSYELWRRSASGSTEGVFTGNLGDSYCFYSIAHDFVGNIEDAPLQPDACTQIIVSTNEPDNSGYQLLQNIPNPFSDETLIGFILPEASDIKLTVTNQLGQTQILLDGKVSPGFYQIPYRSNNAYRSVYFYTLVTPKYTKTLKMIRN